MADRNVDPKNISIQLPLLSTLSVGMASAFSCGQKYDCRLVDLHEINLYSMLSILRQQKRTILIFFLHVPLLS